jgi:hypothetical protein
VIEEFEKNLDSRGPQPHPAHFVPAELGAAGHFFLKRGLTTLSPIIHPSSQDTGLQWTERSVPFLKTL